MWVVEIVVSPPNESCGCGEGMGGDTEGIEVPREQKTREMDRGNTTTKQQNNKTTKQQNNKTTKQQNNENNENKQTNQKQSKTIKKQLRNN